MAHLTSGQYRRRSPQHATSGSPDQWSVDAGHLNTQDTANTPPSRPSLHPRWSTSEPEDKITTKITGYPIKVEGSNIYGQPSHPVGRFLRNR